MIRLLGSNLVLVPKESFTALTPYHWTVRLVLTFLSAIATVMLAVLVVKQGGMGNSIVLRNITLVVLGGIWTFLLLVELTILYKTRPNGGLPKVPYWLGECPGCDTVYGKFAYVDPISDCARHTILRCTCGMEMVIQTDHDGHHHLM